MSSCKRLLGLRNEQWIETNHDYKKAYAKAGLKGSPILWMDTTYIKYVKTLARRDTSFKNSAHHHLQPVQYLLFDKQGRMVSFYVNCFADAQSFPFKLLWNKYKVFDTFPTKSVTPLDTTITLANLSKFLRGDEATLKSLKSDDYEYCEVVLWNHGFYRMSNDLIKLVKNQNKMGKKVKTLFVNDEDSFIWMMANAKDKAEIRKIVEKK